MQPPEPTRLLRYLESRPDDALSLQSLGKWYERRGRNAEAQDAFRRSLAADSTDVFTHLYIGNLAYEQRDWETALIWFEFAAMLEPDMPAPLWAQADVYEFQDRQDLAEEYFRKAVDVDPDDDQARRLLKEWRQRRLWHQAREHVDQGRWESAEGCYREAVDLDPDDERARRILEEWLQWRSDESEPEG